jgi:hypothetical protein
MAAQRDHLVQDEPSLPVLSVLLMTVRPSTSDGGYLKGDRSLKARLKSDSMI